MRPTNEPLADPEVLRGWIRQGDADRGERDDRPTTDMLEENGRLRREVAELRRVNEVLKAASASFRPGARPDPATVMRFIDERRGSYAVALLLRVLDIDESTYYGWVQQAEQPCDRDLVDLGLLSNIYEIWTTSGQTYGADRVWRQLRRDGIGVGRKRVERLMREQGWQGAFLRRGWRCGSTRQNPKAEPAPDRVERDFTAEAPNRLWVADATRIPCSEAVFWLAAVRDAFSNRIVGWKMSDRCDTDLVLGALEYGIWRATCRTGS